ncbi:unnamed protein product [Mycena citricolor]|uniref:Uncharacterized protein n=1 Tax=Mycena citricolor TaxID=2018698 RepID=A0AAD2K0K8_9AGAR|nr:unnamed protein product [Mycena citricolor]
MIGDTLWPSYSAEKTSFLDALPDIVFGLSRSRSIQSGACLSRARRIDQCNSVAFSTVEPVTKPPFPVPVPGSTDKGVVRWMGWGKDAWMWIRPCLKWDRYRAAEPRVLTCWPALALSGSPSRLSRTSTFGSAVRQMRPSS